MERLDYAANLSFFINFHIKTFLIYNKKMSSLIIKNNKIICAIQLTGATSKIRVKKRINNFGNPVSVKKNPFTDDFYIEWQISYFLPFDKIWDNYRKAKNKKVRLKIINDLSLNYKNKNVVSALKNFIQNNKINSKKEFKNKLENIFKKHNETIIKKEHKNDNIYVRYELADMFKFALENNLINKKEIKSLIGFNQDKTLDIEKQYKIIRTSVNKKIYNKFEYYEEKTPLFINKINENNFVEIILEHKQRAVGYQSMIYFCSYIKNLFDDKEQSIIGRTAKSNEIIYLPIGKEDLVNIAESFMVASQDHLWDMKKILNDIIK